MALSADKYQLTRQVYMWLMSCAYMFAFASLYTQIPGLYGRNGLSPVHLVIPRYQSDDNTSLYDRFLSLPSLVVLHDSLQLPPSMVMELCCAIGALLSLLMMVFRALRCSLLFAVLFILYLSMYKVGQVFMSFQWDSLLLEAGFLTILVAPFNLVFWKKPSTQSHDNMTMWLVRWLLFRLMFASGIVKLQSQCPTWWGLTALNHHFETQCIPTPLAWYAHQLPEWLLKLSVVCTYWIESVTPLLFFLPVRSLRIFGCLCQVFLQVLIIVTGNYNFFNFLTITLLLSLVDDPFFGRKMSSQQSFSMRLSRAVFGCYGSIVHRVTQLLAFVTVIGVLISLTVYYFSVSLDMTNWSISSETGFTSEQLDIAMATAVPLLAIVGATSLALEILHSFVNSIFQCGLLSKIWSLVQTSAFASIVIVMFSISLVSHGVLDNTFYNSIPIPVRTVHDSLSGFSLTSPYGLFRRMTGVGGRPEVIVEGSVDGVAWTEFEFLYKPGDVNKPPQFVAPHQPRLDWQMWFAALGNYQNNPWLVHLAYKILTDQPEVLRLMAPPPFSQPPQFVRARLFTYAFTKYDHQRSLFNQTKVWWERSMKSDYLFSLSADNQSLLDFLTKLGFFSKVEREHPITNLHTLLTYLRSYTEMVAPPILLWSLLIAGGMVTLTLYLMFPDHSPSIDARARGIGQGSNGTISGVRNEPTSGVARRRQTSKNKSTS